MLTLTNLSGFGGSAISVPSATLVFQYQNLNPTFNPLVVCDTGPAFDDRHLVFAACANDLGVNSITGFTVDGVNGGLSDQTGTDSGGLYTTMVALLHIAKPTGTTANVSIIYHSSITRFNLAVWAVRGLKTPSGIANATTGIRVDNGTTTNVVLTPTLPCLVFAAASSVKQTTTTWGASGAVESFDVNSAEGTFSAALIPSYGTSLPIDVTLGIAGDFAVIVAGYN